MMEKSYRTIEQNLARIRAEIEDAAVGAGRDPRDIQLMAVTKTVPPEQVNVAIRCGVRLLGENRAQELAEKYDKYNRENIEIHFIGHLQTNKVRQIADKVTAVHSVDRLRLAQELERQCAKLNRQMQVLVEVNIAGEESKSGVEPGAVEELVREMAQLSHLRVCGLMTIPPICEDLLQAERYFSQMQELQVDMRGKNIDNVSMDVLSMGMSGDYIAAVRHGATILRLGSAIFGARR